MGDHAFQPPPALTSLLDQIHPRPAIRKSALTYFKEAGVTDFAVVSSPSPIEVSRSFAELAPCEEWKTIPPGHRYQRVFEGAGIAPWEHPVRRDMPIPCCAACGSERTRVVFFGDRSDLGDFELKYELLCLDCHMHSCFELFAKAVKEKEITLGERVSGELRSNMRDISFKAYAEYLKGDEKNKPISENINHRLFLQELQKGLDGTTDGQGVLQHFLNYIIEYRERLDHFRSSEFELEFLLDEQFDPVEEGAPYFIKGFIDRIDIFEDEIQIVDYKSKKMDTYIDKQKTQQMRELKDMQLALYILFAKRKYGDKKIISYLQSFKSKYEHSEFATAATYEAGKESDFILYDDDFEKALISRIGEIKNSIEKGDFHYDDSNEEHCRWCEFGLMCKKAC